MESIQGKKTYIIAAVVALLGIVQGILGIEIPGVELGDNWIMTVLGALGLGTLRAGVAKSGP